MKENQFCERKASATVMTSEKNTRLNTGDFYSFPRFLEFSINHDLTSGLLNDVTTWPSKINEQAVILLKSSVFPMRRLSFKNLL